MKVESPVIKLRGARRGSGERVLTEKEKSLFDSTLTATGRVSFELSACEQFYTGVWFYQFDEPTCLPWSIANACMVIGNPVDETAVEELVSFAKDEYKPRGIGMNYFEAVRILEKYPTMPVITHASKHLLFNQALWLLAQREGANAISDSTYLHMKRIYESYKVYKSQESTVVPLTADPYVYIPNWPLREMAQLVSSTIDDGKAVLTGVSSLKYRSGGTSTSHAVCISGYRVDNNGYMDVQVIDPYRGIIFMSLDHLHGAVWPVYTFVASKSTS